MIYYSSKLIRLISFDKIKKLPVKKTTQFIWSDYSIYITISQSSSASSPKSYPADSKSSLSAPQKQYSKTLIETILYSIFVCLVVRTIARRKCSFLGCRGGFRRRLRRSCGGSWWLIGFLGLGGLCFVSSGFSVWNGQLDRDG